MSKYTMLHVEVNNDVIQVLFLFWTVFSISICYFWFVFLWLQLKVLEFMEVIESLALQLEVIVGEEACFQIISKKFPQFYYHFKLWDL